MHYPHHQRMVYLKNSKSMSKEKGQSFFHHISSILHSARPFRSSTRQIEDASALPQKTSKLERLWFLKRQPEPSWRNLWAKIIAICAWRVAVDFKCLAQDVSMQGFALKNVLLRLKPVITLMNAMDIRKIFVHSWKIFCKICRVKVGQLDITDFC